MILTEDFNGKCKFPPVLSYMGKGFLLKFISLVLDRAFVLSEGLGKVKLYFYHLKKRTVKIIPCPSTTTDRLHKSRL